MAIQVFQCYQQSLTQLGALPEMTVALASAFQSQLGLCAREPPGSAESLDCSLGISLSGSKTWSQKTTSEGGREIIPQKVTCLVLTHSRLEQQHSGEPALRLAFVDLAGSERLPAEALGGLLRRVVKIQWFSGVVWPFSSLQAGGAVAEESKHINLSSLGFPGLLF